MALDTPTLIADIKAALDAVMSQTNGEDVNRQQLAEDLANAVDAFVRSGLVTVTTTLTAADSGLQTSTGPGLPTGPPAIPIPLTGTGSIG